MGGRKIAGGCLTQGVNSAISPSRAGHGNRKAVDFLQGLFESKLYGGFRILSLPTEEVLPAVRKKETVGNHRGLRVQSSQVLSK